MPAHADGWSQSVQVMTEDVVGVTLKVLYDAVIPNLLEVRTCFKCM